MSDLYSWVRLGGGFSMVVVGFGLAVLFFMLAEIGTRPTLDECIVICETAEADVTSYTSDGSCTCTWENTSWSIDPD